MMEVSEEKQWALDPKYEDIETFEHEFKRRHPFADVLPLRSEWLGISVPMDRGIKGVLPEDYIVEGASKKKETATEEEAKPEVFYCRGCHKEFKYRVAQAGHEKSCKELLKVRI